MTCRYKIQTADRGDIPEIISLVHSVVKESLSDVYPESVRQWFYDYHSIEHLQKDESDGAYILVVKEDGRIIATATYYMTELKRVFIHADRQKLGLGGMLMRELERYAQSAGDMTVMLYANPRSWKYYEAMGYETTSIAAEIMQNGDIFPYIKMKKEFIPTKWRIIPPDSVAYEKIFAAQIMAYSQMIKNCPCLEKYLSKKAEDVLCDIKENCAFIAEAEGEIIGAICAKAKNDVCEVINIWVAPEYQKRYIGACLMHAAEERYLHSEKYNITVCAQNQGAQAFFVEQGYVLAPEQPSNAQEILAYSKFNARKILK